VSNSIDMTSTQPIDLDGFKFEEDIYGEQSFKSEVVITR
jgi:hypothetical protein